MKIVITGASGFIGRKLTGALLAAGHSLVLLGRAPKKGLPAQVDFTSWNPESGPAPAAVFESAGAVIHLAGEPVAQRWTGEVKRRIRESRVTGTANLVKGLEAARNGPKILLSASAIGYYGERGDEKLTEASPSGTGFLAEVSRNWESAAVSARRLGIRVVTLRTGIVLGAGGGALQPMLLPFKLGVGGKLGTGTQWMSWIHLDDAIALIEFALANDQICGPLNLTAPEPVMNSRFTEALAEALGRPAFLPVPLFALRLLYGEMAQVITASQRVLPEVAQKAGYRFRHDKLEEALKDVLTGSQAKP